MTHIYFDDSHHSRGAFSMGAFAVFDDDPSDQINQAIERCGFSPGIDEYKSRHPHAADTRWVGLRRLLFRVTQSAHIGIVVAPYDDRKRFGLHTLTALTHILRENALPSPIYAYLDEGLFHSARQFDAWRRQSGLQADVHITTECDSRLVPGIQAADLVAHSCAVVMLGWLGVSDKTLRDEEEGEYQLSFEMWARFRYNVFTRPLTDPDLQDAAAAGLVDSHNALYIAPGCSEELHQAAESRYGRTWLGCIH